MAGADDINGDGHNDLFVLSPLFDSNRGAIFVLFFGSDGTVGAFSEISTASGTLQYLSDLEAYDLTSASLAAADVDGDGRHDIVMGVRRRSAIGLLFLGADGRPE